MPSDIFPAYVVNWQTPAGRQIDLLAGLLPKIPTREIVIFGSAPLQLLLASDFLSGDVDVFQYQENDLALFVKQNGLAASPENFGFQVTDRYFFRSTSDWIHRAVSVERHGHTFIIPHPWDILVGKLQRLEEKDLEAFRLVIRPTGGPSAEQFSRHLQGAVDQFRPKFDEEDPGGDLFLNTQVLWEKIYQSSTDVRAEIIRPALDRLRRGYEQQNFGDASLKTRLGNLG